MAKAPADPNAVKRVNKPRPCYLLVNLPEGIKTSDIQIVEVTRKAEEALAAIDGGTAGAYLRFEVK